MCKENEIPKAFDFLPDGLRHAAKIDSDQDSQPREAFRHSLAVVVQFMQANEAIRSEKLVTPLMKGLNAICDLDLGRDHLMFEPTRFDCRPPSSVEFLLIQAFAVGISDGLALDPQKRTAKAARKLTAKALERHGLGLVENKRVSGDRIRNWTRSMDKRREDHPLYEQSRQQIILKFDLCNRSDASDLEDRLIDYLLDDCLKPKIVVRTSTD